MHTALPSPEDVSEPGLPLDATKIPRGSEIHRCFGAEEAENQKANSDTELIHYGRQEIFSLRMRYARVVRFMPNLAAAPSGPATTQFDARRARRTCSRSASSRVLNFLYSWGSCLSSARGARRTDPGDRMTARSMKFSSSRTLPGHA